MVGSGIVKAVTGIVKAIAVDGTERILQAGDRVLPNEQIITGDGGAIAVEFSDGTTMDLGRNSDVTLNEATLISYEGNKLASPTLVEDAQGEVAAIQEVLAEDGTFDPSKLDAPAAGGVAAAGGAAGMEDDGSTVVEIDYLNPTMTPHNGFDTTGINVVFPEPLEVLLLEPDESPPPFIIPPSIALSLEATIGYIKEDSTDNVINLNVNVDNPGTDILQTITISQLPSDAILDLTGLTAAAGVSSSIGDGVNTPLVLTLDGGVTNFFGSFKLSPLEDSDVDITGILVTATAINAAVPTLQATASDTLDVVVDAILDERVEIVQDKDAWGDLDTTAIPLNLDFYMDNAGFRGSMDGDSDEDSLEEDSSEKVSSVAITLEAVTDTITITEFGLTLDQYKYIGDAKLTGNPTDGYTLTEYLDTADLDAAIESLAITRPLSSRFSGDIKVTINTITEDTNPNGGLEPDLSDNSRASAPDFVFYARVSDNEFDDLLDMTSTESTEIGFRITDSNLILDSAHSEDQAFNIDFKQLLDDLTPTQLNSFDTVDISGSIGTLEDNQLSLSAQDVLDFNLAPQQQLNIVGNTGDQVNLIDGAGSWSHASNNTTLPDTYSYQDGNGQTIAAITIDDALTVDMS